MNDTDSNEKPRARNISWMASMSVAAGETRAAENYLLELLAWAAFANRDAALDGVTPDGF